MVGSMGGGMARRPAQAGRRHLQRRSIRVMRWRSWSGGGSAVARRGPPSTCWRLSWLNIAHFRRAGLMSMPSRSSRSSARKRRDLRERLALDLVGQQAGAGLADRAAAAGEPDPVDDAVLHAEHQRDAVATERVRALVGGVGILDDPEVVGPPVVLEDVVAVEVVHRRSKCSANVQSRPPGSGLMQANAPPHRRCLSAPDRCPCSLGTKRRASAAVSAAMVGVR